MSDPAAFIARWAASGASERANYVLFLSELCDLLGVPRPEPTKPDDVDNAYVFERNVIFHHADGSTSTGRIDLYKRGCFILEAKQGVEKRAAEAALSAATKAQAKAGKKGHGQRGSAAWDEMLLRAFAQAEGYARALPASEGRPPLLIVVDVGHSIELYSEFTRTGGAYIPFPDPRSHRILLAQLADPAVRETLRLAWVDPQALDPTRRSARVTRDIAGKLGRLAASLEKSGHSAEAVAAFLMRALFTMFAEDVELLPKDSFIGLLRSLEGRAEHFAPMIEELWGRMKTGGFSTVLREKVRHFNGGLFENATALPLTADQFALLLEASRADWRDVEPAIFGTLLERALDAHERHKLGAHYTPRAYVERLVVPTVVEPLRAEWDAAKAAAVTLDRAGKTKDAAAEVQHFHRRLCEVRVLDPACGSGNFLYVTLEHLKRIEGEVLNALDALGHGQAALEMAGFTVDPHQLLGIEVNPRAAAIAELVLWIGYLQWHFRTRGRVAPPEPIIKAFHNIECRDAVLACDGTAPVLDESGAPVTRWDGRTTKPHPVTGEAVPDETARLPLLSYQNPRPADWPQADFIVGNPPFIGKVHMLSDLGEGYVEALRKAYEGSVPDGSDFVMYWWKKAADLVRAGAVSRSGFITTNSITQAFNRRVVGAALGDETASLIFAVPDHPWVSSNDGAAVRIAMTVLSRGAGSGVLATVTCERETKGDYSEVELSVSDGLIHADLTVGANVTAALPLQSNDLLASTGVILGSRGFVLEAEEANALCASSPAASSLIYPLRNGRDILDESRNVFVIDTDGWTAERLISEAPAIYQRLFDRVYPERQQNRDPRLRANWWLFRRSNEQVRAAMAGLSRFIITVETAKHRIFTFLEAGIRPEHVLIVVGTDDASHLGVLSSRIHVVWALATGGTLEDRPRYNKSLCFDPFPFPEATEAHRKRQQSLHPKLTLTDCYNVLEKLRQQGGPHSPLCGQGAEDPAPEPHRGLCGPLSAKEREIHEQGLVSVLRQLHDELDAAVAETYALPPEATDDAILTHLCALNAQRAAEEQQGRVRWLRPAFQTRNAEGGMRSAQQAALDMPEASDTPHSALPTPKSKQPWPKPLPERVRAVADALTTTPQTAAQVTTRFKAAKAAEVEEILDTLVLMGRAREEAEGYVVK
ncbi:MAG: class I SAM-dependent DNA methyltransferase [Verrucomicrobiaceae bacterium]|nr:class I SAM-dependent DNA methyltransferase [Verrucomicrobiaceae bacterium]